ncbi:GntR family transcriptional regulator/MocR family aminotransferase [Arcicella aurantiaca]|uniref:GntR family transcriptional regulator/MocR family aminotransferase n=1 Tax=Arcicella aurantiaca TaxID=591202 RepID=A0A316EG09_9BACT|nr:PLP-dependent aminotransferase family protein [Arcicella aurantiaca]PWK21880.1 GntR family transcriptional regulator/MocR family aminotransferase [Arcicella aurantiaca]
MQIPFKTLLEINKESSLPIYVQIANGISQNIQAGILKTGTKLLGTRQMAELLEVHRKTVVAAYDELYSEGWIEVFPQKGTFVAQHLPTVKPVEFSVKQENTSHEIPNLTIAQNAIIKIPPVITHRLAFNDGLPDIRLAPREELARLYAHYIKFGDSSILQYTNPYGHIRFREVFSAFLNETRGMNILPQNILTTRGSQMAFYLIGSALFQKNDEMLVGSLNYPAANMTFESLGLKLNIVPIDEDGIVVDAVEEICKQKSMSNTPIKAIYITSHHYHPTTVTLKPERRIKLLALAEKYDFYIIEDDYDYDYHYANRPVLPLASADRHGLVIYLGSFTKRIAPTFRVGYIVAKQEIIDELAKYRRIMDRQGDTILELSLADMLEDGTLKRYTTKAVKTYRERRDFTCDLLKNELGNIIDFKIPDGGMAIWAKFDKSISLMELSEKVGKKGLYLSNGSAYGDLNACRMGFSSMNLKEMEESVGILKVVI